MILLSGGYCNDRANVALSTPTPIPVVTDFIEIVSGAYPPDRELLPPPTLRLGDGEEEDPSPSLLRLRLRA
jgi:hypothetical protein